MMKGFVITVLRDWSPDSIVRANRCIQSIKDTASEVECEIFEATTPETLEEHQKQIWKKDLNWSWPIRSIEDGLDFKTGIYKKHYRAANISKVWAATISHARVWQKCVDLDEPVLILEEDSIFTRKFKYDMLFQNPDHNFKNGGACGLNDPRGTTRKSAIFYNKVLAFNNKGVYNVPNVDENEILNYASGLAGNSAYVIKPYAAKALIEKTEQVGIWPNDALMCRQLFSWLKVSYPFYTKVQGTFSTTTS